MSPPLAMTRRCASPDTTNARPVCSLISGWCLRIAVPYSQWVVASKPFSRPVSASNIAPEPAEAMVAPPA